MPSIVAAPRKTRHSRLTRELFGEAVGTAADGVVGEATIKVVEQRAGQGAIAAVACELGEPEEVFARERPELRIRLQSGADAHDAAFSIVSKKLPRVAIAYAYAYAYAGIEGDDIRAAAADAKGIVIAGVGAGGFTPSARQAVKDFTSKGIPVIRTARQGAGDVG